MDPIVPAGRAIVDRIPEIGVHGSPGLLVEMGGSVGFDARDQVHCLVVGVTERPALGCRGVQFFHECNCILASGKDMGQVSANRTRVHVDRRQIAVKRARGVRIDGLNLSLRHFEGRNPFGLHVSVALVDMGHQQADAPRQLDFLVSDLGVVKDRFCGIAPRIVVLRSLFFLVGLETPILLPFRVRPCVEHRLRGGDQIGRIRKQAVVDFVLELGFFGNAKQLLGPEYQPGFLHVREGIQLFTVFGHGNFDRHAVHTCSIYVGLRLH